MMSYHTYNVICRCSMITQEGIKVAMMYILVYAIGWCFIGFRTIEQAKTAIAEVNHKIVAGRPLDVKQKENRYPRDRQHDDMRDRDRDRERDHDRHVDTRGGGGDRRTVEDRRLFVYGLLPEMDEDFIRQQFGKCGVVKEVFMKKTPENLNKGVYHASRV